MDVVRPQLTTENGSGGMGMSDGAVASAQGDTPLGPMPSVSPAPNRSTPAQHPAAHGLALDVGLATILSQSPHSLAVALKNMHTARLLQAQRADNGTSSGPLLSIKPLAAAHSGSLPQPHSPSQANPSPIPLLASRTASDSLNWPRTNAVTMCAQGSPADTLPLLLAQQRAENVHGGEETASTPIHTHTGSNNPQPLHRLATGASSQPHLSLPISRSTPHQSANNTSASAAWTDAAADFTLPSNLPPQPPLTTQCLDAANNHSTANEAHNAYAHVQPDVAGAARHQPSPAMRASPAPHLAPQGSSLVSKGSASLALALAIPSLTTGTGLDSQAGGAVDSVGYQVGGPGSLEYPQRRFLDGYKAVSFVRTNELKQLFGPDARTRLPVNCTLRVELDGVMQAGVNCQVTFKETGAQNSVYYIKGFKAALALRKFHCGFRRLDASTAVLLLRSVPTDETGAQVLGSPVWAPSRGRGNGGAGRGVKREAGNNGFDVGPIKRGRRMPHQPHPAQRSLSSQLPEVSTDSLWGGAAMTEDDAMCRGDFPCSDTEDDEDAGMARGEGMSPLTGVEGEAAQGGLAAGSGQPEVSLHSHGTQAAAAATSSQQQQATCAARPATAPPQPQQAGRAVPNPWGNFAQQQRGPGQLLSTLADVAAAFQTKRLPPPAVPNPWLPPNRQPAKHTAPTQQGRTAPPAVTSDLLTSPGAAKTPATPQGAEQPTNAGLAALAAYVHAGLINSASPLPVLLLESAPDGTTPAPADVRAALAGVLQALRHIGASQQAMLAAYQAFTALQGRALYTFCVEAFTLLSLAHSSGQRNLVVHALGLGLGQGIADMLQQPITEPAPVQAAVPVPSEAAKPQPEEPQAACASPPPGSMSDADTNSQQKGPCGEPQAAAILGSALGSQQAKQIVPEHTTAALSTDAVCA